jgi:hypothetical protein
VSGRGGAVGGEDFERWKGLPNPLHGIYRRFTVRSIRKSIRSIRKSQSIRTKVRNIQLPLNQRRISMKDRIEFRQRNLVMWEAHLTWD